MMHRCHFLHVAKCQALFSAGKAIQGERAFRELKPDAQLAIHGLLTKVEKPILAIGHRLAKAVFLPSLFGIDEQIATLWKESSSEKKAQLLEEFMDKQVALKLQRETNDAALQGKKQLSNHRFETALSEFPFPHFAPFYQLSIGVQSLVLHLAKICFLPWGIYSLYRFLQNQDHSTLPFGVAHLQGRRSSMEDEHLVTMITCRLGQKKMTIPLFGIFDGHGGDSAAKFAKTYFASYLKEALEKHASSRLTDARVFTAFKEACFNLDAAYTGKAGSTVSVSAIIHDHLWTCTLGDSRVIANVKGRAIQLSEDQKCDLEKYARGVKKNGGEIQHRRVVNLKNHIALAVPRALGDHVMKKSDGRDPIIHTPKITKVPLKMLEGGQLILACDGLWDESATSQVASFVQEHKEKMDEEGLAKAIVAKAYHAGSSDNISVLVVDLGDKKKK